MICHLSRVFRADLSAFVSYMTDLLWLLVEKIILIRYAEYGLRLYHIQNLLVESNNTASHASIMFCFCLVLFDVAYDRCTLSRELQM